MKEPRIKKICKKIYAKRKRHRLLQHVIPHEDVADEEVFATGDEPSKMIQRPGFSLPVMTTNFRRFNARYVSSAFNTPSSAEVVVVRIGVVFVFQKRVERVLSWRTPSHTLSLLAILTFVCLNPYLLAALLPASIVLFIMVPAFLVRHPPPPTTTIPNTITTYSLTGPPLAPAKTIKPAGEMSKDFFRNMRDLQNSMEDFAVVHDFLIRLLTPYTNFGNERNASALYLVLVISSCALLLFSRLLPWRLLALLTAWTIVSIGHPAVQSYLREPACSSPSPAFSPSNPLACLRALIADLAARFTQDIVLTSPPQMAEVEIFELHRLQRGEFVPWIFSPNPYDPLSPLRISAANNGRPQGTRFFEDVAPPSGWEWASKKWELDMDSKGWVEERMVQSVMVEEEGERWVIDLLAKEHDERDEEQAEDHHHHRNWEVRDGKLVGGIEESLPGRARRGEWRRRRWVRIVKRKAIEGE